MNCSNLKSQVVFLMQKKSTSKQFRLTRGPVIRPLAFRHSRSRLRFPRSCTATDNNNVASGQHPFRINVTVPEKVGPSSRHYGHFLKESQTYCCLLSKPHISVQATRIRTTQSSNNAPHRVYLNTLCHRFLSRSQTRFLNSRQ